VNTRPQGRLARVVVLVRLHLLPLFNVNLLQSFEIETGQLTLTAVQTREEISLVKPGIVIFPSLILLHHIGLPLPRRTMTQVDRLIASLNIYSTALLAQPENLLLKMD